MSRKGWISKYLGTVEFHSQNFVNSMKYCNTVIRHFHIKNWLCIRIRIRIPYVPYAYTVYVYTASLLFKHIVRRPHLGEVKTTSTIRTGYVFFI